MESKIFNTVQYEATEIQKIKHNYLKYKDSQKDSKSPYAIIDKKLYTYVKKAIKEIIVAVGATSMKDMGKVMGIASKKLAGTADGKAISEMVKKILV